MNRSQPTPNATLQPALLVRALLLVKGARLVRAAPMPLAPCCARQLLTPGTLLSTPPIKGLALKQRLTCSNSRSAAPIGPGGNRLTGCIQAPFNLQSSCMQMTKKVHRTAIEPASNIQRRRPNPDQTA